MFDIREDDLSGEATRALLALHLVGMQENSPPDHVLALDLSALKAPNITVWSVWDGDILLGIGALKELGDGTGNSSQCGPTPIICVRASPRLSWSISLARRADVACGG
jgi:hypothetical protein